MTGPGRIKRTRIEDENQGGGLLSQTSEYALRAMACMALKPEEKFTAGELAKTTRVPQDYLAKVLQQLAGAGLIRGRRGVGGGYSLTKPPERINLIEVINAVATLQRITTCPLGISTHGSNLCPLHREVDRAIAAAMDVFGGRTLADVLNEPGANTPLCESPQPMRPTIGGVKIRG